MISWSASITEDVYTCDISDFSLQDLRDVRSSVVRHSHEQWRFALQLLVSNADNLRVSARVICTELHIYYGRRLLWFTVADAAVSSGTTGTQVNTTVVSTATTTTTSTTGKNRCFYQIWEFRVLFTRKCKVCRMCLFFYCHTC